jgi:hypothetical protein
MNDVESRVIFVDDVKEVMVRVPALTAQNLKAIVAPAGEGSNWQLVTASVDPVQPNSDVCDPPSELPTTNLNSLNVAAELVVITLPLPVIPVPTFSTVKGALPLTFSDLLPPTFSSSAKSNGPLTRMSQVLGAPRWLHRYPSVTHGQSLNPHDGLSQLPAFTY